MHCIQVTDSDWKYLTKRKVDTGAKRIADAVSQVIQEAKVLEQSKN